MKTSIKNCIFWLAILLFAVAAMGGSIVFFMLFLAKGAQDEAFFFSSIITALFTVFSLQPGYKALKNIKSIYEFYGKLRSAPFWIARSDDEVASLQKTLEDWRGEPLLQEMVVNQYILYCYFERKRSQNFFEDMILRLHENKVDTKVLSWFRRWLLLNKHWNISLASFLDRWFLEGVEEGTGYYWDDFFLTVSEYILIYGKDENGSSVCERIGADVVDYCEALKRRDVAPRLECGRVKQEDFTDLIVEDQNDLKSFFAGFYRQMDKMGKNLSVVSDID